MKHVICPVCEQHLVLKDGCVKVVPLLLHRKSTTQQSS